MLSEESNRNDGPRQWLLRKRSYIKKIPLTSFRYSATSCKDSFGSPEEKMEGFHMAARATMTEEAPVSCRKNSKSSWKRIVSREPPLWGENKKKFQDRKAFTDEFVKQNICSTSKKCENNFEKELGTHLAITGMVKLLLICWMTSSWFRCRGLSSFRRPCTARARTPVASIIRAKSSVSFNCDRKKKQRYPVFLLHDAYTNVFERH